MELCDPITLPTGDVPGARVLAELSPEHGVLLFDLLRVVSTWVAFGSPKVIDFIKPYFERIDRGMEWINVPPAKLFWAYREPKD